MMRGKLENLVCPSAAGVLLTTQVEPLVLQGPWAWCEASWLARVPEAEVTTVEDSRGTTGSRCKVGSRRASVSKWGQRL